MILFVNVFITKNYITKYERGLLATPDRLDVFKYSLASLSVIPWTKVFIYAQLDECYQDRSEELKNYINSLFKDAVYRTQRLDKQSKWQKAMEEVFAVNDELVWFTCNDDHVFIDYNLDVLNAIEKRLHELMSNGYKHVASYISHFPEMLRHVNYGEEYPVLDKHKESFEVQWDNIDSIQIVNKAVLKHWWFAHDYGEDVFLIRTDGNIKSLGDKYIAVEKDLYLRTLIPLREICRHFDGYCRPYNPGVSKYMGSSDINRCPPLFIPDGFFDNNIRLSYNMRHRIDGYVHVNPFLANYSSIDPLGADCKWVIPDDIPMFWMSRLSDIYMDKNGVPEFDRALCVHARNKAVMDLANAEIDPMGISRPVPMDWLEVAYR